MGKTNHNDKTPEQVKAEAINTAIAAERTAKNKAHAAADAYESNSNEAGVYGDLSKRAIKLQELALAGRDVPPPTEEEVAAAEAAAKEATAGVDAALA